MEITQIKTFTSKMDSFIDMLLPELEEIYKDIHRNLELSMQEFRTAKIAADYLTKYQFEVSTRCWSNRCGRYYEEWGRTCCDAPGGYGCTSCY